MGDSTRASVDHCLALKVIRLTSHWSILLILASHWSIFIVFASHWSILLILASHWSIQSDTAHSAVTAASHVTMSASSGLSHNQPVKIKDAAVKIKGAAMKAVILSGKPATRAAITDLLSISDTVPVPEVKGDQVLVRVRATALNIEAWVNIFPNARVGMISFFGQNSAK